jgi:hypothetical protein
MCIYFHRWTDVELKKVPFSGRVSPTDVPDFLMKKLDVVLSTTGPLSYDEEAVGGEELLETESNEDLF